MINLETSPTAFCRIFNRRFDESKNKWLKDTLWLEPWTVPTTKTLAQIAMHFATVPDAAIAIRTGRQSNLTVIDFDTKDNDLILALYAEAPTYMVETANGFHLYYKFNNDPILQMGTKKFGDTVDVRNEGGMIFAPPTPCYTISQDIEVAELSPAALELLRPFATSGKMTERGLPQTTTRNDDLFRMACAWINLYPKEEVFARMSEANKGFHEGKGELSIKDMETLYRQACKYDPKEMAKQAVAKTMEKLAEPVRAIDDTKRYTWGTYALDRSFAIIKQKDFIVLGAKRGSGKTTFAYDMAMKNARDMGHKVLFVSLEMEEGEILSDLGRKYAGINVGEEFESAIPEYKKRAYDEKISEIKSIKNLIFEGVRRAEGITWAMIEEIIKKHNPDMIFVDNLDLISAEGKENDMERQKHISASIMNFTSKHIIPLILIHHYRKSGKTDQGMDELSGSGKIADNADRVVRVKKNFKLDEGYPKKYQSEIYLQKGRGYPEHCAFVYFIRGTFVDEAPPEILYNSQGHSTPSQSETADFFSEMKEREPLEILPGTSSFNFNQE